ncbi:hypothetical protein PVAG01_09155 [Phlyctema vagabunda]|uniref:Uncharacterized protein n=1 Tax=Phlyctema vagabunda TaxID=108571 RepID=A0ABR4P6K8_9HELO
MSKQPSDSFLPSGAMESPLREFGPSRSGPHVPRTMPDYIPSPTSHETPKPYSQSQSSLNHTPNGPPLSPPKTRSGSTDNSTAALVENWRAYSRRLMTQFDGEKKEMLANRERVEDLWKEERGLWDEEKNILMDRISKLESQLEKIKAASQLSTGSNSQILSRTGSQRRAPTSGMVSAAFASPGSIDGTAAKAVPQESGRNADGSAYYAPAPQNPSRTFDTSESDTMRVDDLTAPREDPIRVTAKELTSSDFGVQSPPAELASISETPAETIDISHIQPELEGVPIKASAVAPSFAAKVLSPNSALSPARLSPNIRPPPRDITNLNRSISHDKKPTALDVMRAPIDHRLTMHAGHTPNHSISNFSLINESGHATPVATQESKDAADAASTAGLSELHGDAAQELDEDPELTGKLGLSTDRSPADLEFLAKLTERLEEVRKSGTASPVNEAEAAEQGADASTNPDPEDANLHDSTSPMTGAVNAYNKWQANEPRTRDSLGLFLNEYLGPRDEKENTNAPAAGTQRKNEEPVDEETGETEPIIKLKPSMNFGRPMGFM